MFNSARVASEGRKGSQSIVSEGLNLPRIFKQSSARWCQVYIASNPIKERNAKAFFQQRAFAQPPSK
jgi:hypothetical protein